MQPQKWQRNEIYQAIEAGGLDANECRFDYGVVTWRIAHVPSGSYLLVGGRPGHYKLTQVAGDGPTVESESFTWPTVPEKVARWAHNVKRDVDTPDLWEEVQRRQEVLTAATYEHTDNAPFTPVERAEIADQIRQIKEFLREARSLPEARTASTEAKLDYVASAAGRVGRKDWQLMFGAAILGVFMTDLLPREVVWDLLTRASHLLDHLFGDGGGPPQLPPTPPPLV